MWNKVGGTYFPDFTHPKAALFWKKQISKFHDILKFDGLWLVSLNMYIKTKLHSQNGKHLIYLLKLFIEIIKTMNYYHKNRCIILLFS